MTTGHFTKSAINFADGKPMELIDGDKLKELLANYEINDQKVFDDDIKAEEVFKSNTMIEDEYDYYVNTIKKLALTNDERERAEFINKLLYWTLSEFSDINEFKYKLVIFKEIKTQIIQYLENPREEKIKYLSYLYQMVFVHISILQGNFTDALTMFSALMSNKDLQFTCDETFDPIHTKTIVKEHMTAFYRIAGKFQVSTTVIKMIPLALMAVVGTVVGISNGRMAENFATMASGAGEGGGLMGAAVAVAFAYEGWILTTSINAELKDAKKNLPRALILGAFIVVAIYILYYIGLNGAVTTEELMASGETAAKMAFQRVFGETAGTLVFVLIVISCLGTLNGLMLSCCRCMYSLAARGQGPLPTLFRQVDPVTNMPSNSAIFSLAVDGFWLLYFYGANLTAPWFGSFSFDSSELPIVTLYGMYIPMFIMFAIKSKELGGFKRWVMPALGFCGCCFMVYAAFAAYGKTVWFYLIVFAVVMAIGNLFYRKDAAAK